MPDFGIDVPKDATRARFPGSAMNTSLLPLSEMPALPQFDETPSIVARRERESRVERAGAAEPLTEIPSWLDANLLQPTHRDAAPEPSTPAAPVSDPAGMDDATTEAAAAAADSTVSGAASKSDDSAAVATFAEPVSAPTPPAAEPASAPAVEPTEAEANAHADLAETIYYQVLQNLDLYTERALQEHLTRHLAPIIKRAGDELLSTLNANLGAVIRQYVAEAIEKQLGVRPTTDGPAGTAR